MTQFNFFTKDPKFWVDRLKPANENALSLRLSES